MRIVKPDWLHHDADKKKLTSIFSLDFHPDGTRLATAGMDNKIRLWSTHAISNSSNSSSSSSVESSDEPRLLSTLTAHSGAVMCVRFSNGSGRYMASGADDMVVLIWEKDSEVSTGNLTGNLAGGAGPTETWRPQRRLTGHESDVCDLAWSPDNRFLATCGLDNAIFIWDGRTFERIKKLTDHSQFVKGLTFDPAGRYLASQSDDKTLRIWRTSDWALHKTVSEPFEDNIFSTYFRRPSWSPDGECVATANAANGKAPVAAVVSRDSWAADLSFVGHRGAIEAVRFNPRVFAAAGKDDGGGVVTICAAGGQDRGVTVWLTSQHMPIAAATNLFAGNLMDLAWHTVEPSSSSDNGDDDDDNSDGAVVALLAACSYDGTVAVMEFTQAELGRPIPIDDQEKMLEKYGFAGRRRRRKRARVDDDDGDGDDDDGGDYGDGDGGDANGRPKPLAESVEQLRLEQQGAALSKVPKETRVATDAAQDSAAAAAPADAPVPVPVPVPVPMPVPVRTKDGKKRVAPLFVRPLGGARESVQRETMPPPVTTTTGPAASAEAAPASTTARPAAAAALAAAAAAAAPERQTVDPPLWIEARVLGTRQMRGGGGGSASAGGYVLGPQSLVHAQSISAARVLLSVPRVLAQVPSSLDGRPQAVAYNSARADDGQPQAPVARLVCTRAASSSTASASTASTTAWTKYFSSAVVMLASSDVLTAASLADGSLHWFDTRSGARLLPPLVDEAQAAHLVCRHGHCLLLSAVGLLTVWDVGRLAATVDHVSVAPLLYCAELSAPAPAEDADGGREEDGGRVRAPRRHRPAVALTAVDVSQAGAPLLSFSDGRSYTYHAGMRTWLRLASPLDHQASDHYMRPSTAEASAPPPSASGGPVAFARTTATPLGYLQELGYHQYQATRQVNGRKPGMPPLSDSSARLADGAVRRSVTLDHVEQMVRAAADIGSQDDVVRYVDVLARLLAQGGGGDEARASYWLASLLGPPLATGLCPEVGAETWRPRVAGIPKRQLLQRMLPLLAANRSLQSLVTEYSTALNKLL
ncbi:HIR complex subunit [Coemansia erecta]|uniref:Protein HIR n=1 Tax=Coemansia erecta TaxID=147472 RepID=A0A9W7Y2S3_9FUNG|nr:HIR complex subunit [Coemansia erecta]